MQIHPLSITSDIARMQRIWIYTLANNPSFITKINTHILINIKILQSFDQGF